MLNLKTINRFLKQCNIGSIFLRKGLYKSFKKNFVYFSSGMHGKNLTNKKGFVKKP